MDTPRSESPTYNSRPAAELDDHRYQAHGLPRPGPPAATTARRPDITKLMEGNAHRSRDNEYAVYDDSEMIMPSFLGMDATPAVLDFAGAGARSIRDDADSIRFPSRISSRSPSPPNSVDAFADPGYRRARGRAGTVDSQMPDLTLGLQRTVSRRPTFVEDNDRDCGSADNISLKPEQDVCFPPPVEPRFRGAAIDFEEMDEFVMMQNRGRSSEPQRKMSVAAGSFKDGRFGHDVSPNLSAKTEATGASSVIDEKATIPEHPSRSATIDRFSFFSSEMDTTIHAPQIGDLLFDNECFHDLFRGGQGVWWLDCLNPTSDELTMLMKAFAIHPLTAEDIRVQETREKVELFNNYYFVCFRSFVQNKASPDYLTPINVYIIVFREGVLSFHFAANNHSANVRRRIRQLRDYVALSADWICYALIDDIVDSFAPLIMDIENDADAIEDAVFIARGDDYSVLLKRIGECRKRTMGGMRLLGGPNHQWQEGVASCQFLIKTRK